MKTRVVTVTFFLAGVLLEMRNALPKNGLKGFPRGKLTVPWEHLPVLRGDAHRVNLKKQTASNTEDITGSNARAYYVAKLFHGMASRSTNQRPFLKEFKVRFLCLLDPFLFWGMYLLRNQWTALSENPSEWAGIFDVLHGGACGEGDFVLVRVFRREIKIFIDMPGSLRVVGKEFNCCELC